MDKLKKALLYALIFGVIGPFLGILPVSVGFWLNDLFIENETSILFQLFRLGYIIGGIPAILTGLICAYITPNGFRSFMLIGIVGAILSCIIIPIMHPGGGIPIFIYAIMMVLGFIPAFLLAWLVPLFLEWGKEKLKSI